MKTQIIILFLLFSTTATYAQRPADSAKYKPWVFTEMKIDADTVLHFSTENEPDTPMIFVERFKWNKWLIVDSVQGMGKAKNDYEVKVQVLRGCYSFRVRGGYRPHYWYSPSAKICSKGYVPITFRPRKVKDSIWFSEPTKYEIYDANGNVVHKGEGKGVKVRELKKGIYYINFYVEMGKFLKK